MYWTDWGEEPRIERAGMDGSNRYINLTLVTILHEKAQSSCKMVLCACSQQESYRGRGHILAQRSDDRPGGTEAVLGRRQTQLHSQSQPGWISTVCNFIYSRPVLTYITVCSHLI